MKHILFASILFVFGTLVSSAQSTEKATWKEKDAFHEVMSKTFHPAQEGKFDAIRSRSAEMFQKALAWQESKAPATIDRAALAVKFDELVKGANALNKLVLDKADNATILKSLTALHDVFHSIVEKCEEK
jgi:hypothetical protein